jgi:hypothetical protein
MMEAVCSPKTVVSTYRAHSQCDSASRCEPHGSLVGQDASGRQGGPYPHMTHIADNDSVHTRTYPGVTQNTAFRECILILGSISRTNTDCRGNVPHRPVTSKYMIPPSWIATPLLYFIQSPLHLPFVSPRLSPKDINPDGGNCSDCRNSKIFLLYDANAQSPNHTLNSLAKTSVLKYRRTRKAVNLATPVSRPPPIVGRNFLRPR